MINFLEMSKMNSWINNSYSDAGYFAAKSARLMGIAPAPVTEIFYKTRDQLTPAVFASGWFSMNIDTYDEIEPCF